MTYDVTHHHHPDPHIDAVAGAALTHIVYAGFAASINSLRAMIGQRGSWIVLKALKKQLVDLCKTERGNFELWLRHSLARNSAWRKSVLADLGGERALRQWTRRVRMASEPRPDAGPSRQKTRIPATRQTDTPRSGIKTDALGLFRLAPVKTHAPKTARRGSASYSGLRSSPLFPDLKPIGLTPDDLRYGSGEPSGVDEAHVNTVAPYDLWASMMGRIITVHQHLLHVEGDMLDAQITARIQSAAPAPTAHAAEAKDAAADYIVTHPV